MVLIVTPQRKLSQFIGINETYKIPVPQQQRRVSCIVFMCVEPAQIAWKRIMMILRLKQIFQNMF